MFCNLAFVEVSQHELNVDPGMSCDAHVVVKEVSNHLANKPGRVRVSNRVKQVAIIKLWVSCSYVYAEAAKHKGHYQENVPRKQDVDVW